MEPELHATSFDVEHLVSLGVKDTERVITEVPLIDYLSKLSEPSIFCVPDCHLRSVATQESHFAWLFHLEAKRAVVKEVEAVHHKGSYTSLETLSCTKAGIFFAANHGLPYPHLSLVHLVDKILVGGLTATDDLQPLHLLLDEDSVLEGLYHGLEGERLPLGHHGIRVDHGHIILVGARLLIAHLLLLLELSLLLLLGVVLSLLLLLGVVLSLLLLLRVVLALLLLLRVVIALLLLVVHTWWSRVDVIHLAYYIKKANYFYINL